jgi:hypothetical protein
MPSDDASLSHREVRHIVREETDAALRYQRRTLFGALALFCGGQLLLVGVALVGLPLYAVAGGGVVALFGLLSILGQRSFGERRTHRLETRTSRDD